VTDVEVLMMRRTILFLSVAGFVVALVVLVPSRSTPQVDSPAPSHDDGATVTLLPDGRELVVGGEDAPGRAVLRDGQTGVVTPLASGPHVPRAWHSATVLPDGVVLVWGGIGVDGEPTGRPERFEPMAQTWTSLDAVGAPRAMHSATLLTDGRVLVAGGVGTSTLELFDPRTGRAETVPSELGRYAHEATLLPDGRVLLWGGFDDAGTAIDDGVVFDPATNGLASIEATDDPVGGDMPRLAGSVPADGATDVSPDALIGLRFPTALDPATVDEQSFRLIGPLGVTAVRVVASEDGMLVFLTPVTPLESGAAYRVAISDVSTADGSELADGTVAFTTVSRVGVLLPATPPGRSARPNVSSHPQKAKHHIPEGDVWRPGEPALAGDWRIGLPDSPWQSLPALEAAPGVTALAGQILRVDGWPLEGVSIRIGGSRTATDETGRFLLTRVPAGRQTLVVDAGPASTRKTKYGFFMIAVDVVATKTTALPYTVWMPVIDVEHTITIPSPTTRDMVVTTPLVPGLEVHIPAHVRLRKPDGTIATEIGVTPIPVDRPPFPLPAGVYVPVYFTLQPGGAVVESVNGGSNPGIALVFPNTIRFPSESMIPYWSYDAAGRGWIPYGHGRVDQRDTQIVPDRGVTIDRLTCASIGGDGPGPGGCPGCCGNTAGDPVELSTGIFVQQERDFFLADVLPIDFVRTYRSRDTLARAFGLGTTHPYDMSISTLTPGTCASLAVVLLDEAGSRVTFTQSGGGSSCSAPNPMQPNTSSPGRYYGSGLTFVANRDPTNAEGYQGRSGWDFRLADGTVYELTTFYTPARTVLTAIQDRYGNRLRIQRELLDQFAGNGGARVKRITSPNGRWLDFTYVPHSIGSKRIARIVDNTGRSVDYAYDGTARLTSVTRVDPAGSRTPYRTTYTYAGTSANMATVRNARLTAECPAPCSQPPSLSLEYWPDGALKKEILGDGVSSWQFAYTFPSPGYPTTRSSQTDVTDPGGIVRRVTFNAGGYKTSETLAFGIEPEQQTTVHTRQAGTNLLLASVDPLGRRNEYTYDIAGSLRSITRLAGTVNAVATTLDYDATFNLVKSITDPLGHVTRLTYRPNGTLQSLIDPTGNTWTYGATATGRVSSITDPYGETTQLGYTGGDLTSVTDATGNTTSRVVDGSGRLRRVIDPLSHVTAHDYDALDRLVQSVDALGGVTTLTYDAADNLVATADANQHGTTYTYDGMNRLQRRVDPLGRAETFTYDALGTVLTWTDRKGQVTEYRYDALGRRTFTGYKKVGSTFESTIAVTYDDGDRPLTVVDTSGGTIARVYDDLDRLTSETTPQGTVTYAYDVAGRRQMMTIGGIPGTVYTYGYDADDHLTSIVQGMTTVGLTYDNAGRQSRVTLPNGIVVTYEYDPAGRVAAITGRRGMSTVLRLTYAYDAAGNRIAVDGDSKRTSHPVSVSGTSHDAANELTSWSGVPQAYDANGNLTSVGTTTYSWNARDQLTGITGGGLTATFAYDGFGRRTSRTVNGATTTFAYDGFNRVKATVGSATSLMLQGLGLDQHFARIDGASVTSFLVDAIGSTYALTDGTGAVTAQYRYEPYGAATRMSGTGATDLLFTGREDDGTGFAYHRARYYAFGRGRFVSEDPIRDHWWNLFSYADESPLLKTDPLGLSTVTFDRGSRSISAYDHCGQLLFSCAAGNNVVAGARRFPDGTFPFSWYNRHPESGPRGPYGSHGIFIWEVPGRTGMGLHSGRDGPESPTHGCVRTTDDCMQRLLDLQQSDPLTEITID
jgi:RHS repeat-associated protein